MKKIPKKELGWSLETPLDQILIHQFKDIEIDCDLDYAQQLAKEYILASIEKSLQGAKSWFWREFYRNRAEEVRLGNMPPAFQIAYELLLKKAQILLTYLK